MSATLAGVASAIALIYPIAESIVHEYNAKKVSKKRREIDQILSRFNLKIDQLRKDLEIKGINYNQLMDRLAYSSPVGSAHKIKQEAEKQYRSDVETINSQIANATDTMNQYAAIENKKLADQESKGIIRTILGD